MASQQRQSASQNVPVTAPASVDQPSTAAPLAASGGASHRVQHGETAASIAELHYGDASMWTAVRDANPELFDGEAPIVGTIIVVPLMGGGAGGAGGGAGDGTASSGPDSASISVNASGGGAGASGGGTGAASAAELDPAVLEYLSKKLSTGFFDWWVSGGDINSVANKLAEVPPELQVTYIFSLGDKQRQNFFKNLHKGNEVTNDLLKNVFDALPDSDLENMTAVMNARFDFKLGERGADWDAAGLRRTWEILEVLPPEHVEDNDVLDLLLRGGTTDGSGYYRGSDDSAVVSYGNLNATGSYGSIWTEDENGQLRDVGLNSSVNLFNTVMRHEIGHAVDAKIGASDEGGYVQTSEAAGRWAEYGSKGSFADAIIEAGGGMSSHGYADADAYESALRRAIKKGENFRDALAAVAPDAEAPGADVTGPVAAVLTTNRWASDSSPWYNYTDGSEVGGRKFHEAYGGRFISYQANARTQRGISAYQFRAPGEWFAEAYAVYYSDHMDTTGRQAGTSLRSRDAATATWFDTSVDKGHSLVEESGQAPAEDGHDESARSAGSTAAPGA